MKKCTSDIVLDQWVHCWSLRTVECLPLRSGEKTQHVHRKVPFSWQQKMVSSFIFQIPIKVLSVSLWLSSACPFPVRAPAPEVGSSLVIFPLPIRTCISRRQVSVFKNVHSFQWMNGFLKLSWLLGASLSRLGGLEKSTAAQSVTITAWWILL